VLIGRKIALTVHGVLQATAAVSLILQIATTNLLRRVRVEYTFGQAFEVKHVAIDAAKYLGYYDLT
jgi:hypothetical protein